MGKYEHIKRLIILTTVILLGFIALRFFFIPKDFGKYGHYRPQSVEENMNRPQNFAQSSVCAACHEERHKTWSTGKHKTVACENCHGTLLKHTEDPTAVKPKKPEGRNFCALCHAKNITRPKSFPQVNLNSHNWGMECITCHNPHSPRL